MQEARISKATMAAEGQMTENPGFSRLLELLHGSYLRKGVRKSVASKLEEVSVYYTAIQPVGLLHSL